MRAGRMISSLTDKCRSLWNLCWLVMRSLTGAAGAFLRGDRSRARGYLHLAADATHLDLAHAAMTLSRLLPFRPRLDSDVDRILIVKLDRIGDMVNTTPVFDILK